MNKKSKQIFSWLNPKLELRKTEKYGKGVFAEDNLKKNELLAIFGGYIMTIKKEERLSKKVSDNSIQISDDFVLGVKKIFELEDASFFNHSCDPNAGFNGQIFLVAMRGIKKDEEITFDYAMVLCKSKGAKYYKFKCLCGKSNCRRYLTEEDWKILELQKKYSGYFQWYLQEKINKIKK